jgi:DNA replication protein DnaC
VAASLIGRADELRVVHAFLDRAAFRGGALVLSGEAGVGKSVLLDVAAEAAAQAGGTLLRARSVEFAADL